MITNIKTTILKVQSHCVYNLFHMLKLYITWQIMKVMNLRSTAFFEKSTTILLLTQHNNDQLLMLLYPQIRSSLIPH